MNENKSLWNLCKGKTISVIKYIKKLETTQKWNNKQEKRFFEIINNALNSTTANEMLNIIGYRFNERPKIYDKINHLQTQS